MSTVVRGTPWTGPWNAVEVRGHSGGAPPKRQKLYIPLRVWTARVGVPVQQRKTRCRDSWMSTSRYHDGRGSQVQSGSYTTAMTSLRPRSNWWPYRSSLPPRAAGAAPIRRPECRDVGKGFLVKLLSKYCVNPFRRYLGMPPRSRGLAQGLQRSTGTWCCASIRAGHVRARSKSRSLSPREQPSDVSLKGQGATSRVLYGPFQLSTNPAPSHPCRRSRLSESGGHIMEPSPFTHNEVGNLPQRPKRAEFRRST